MEHLDCYRRAANYFDHWSLAVPARDRFIDWIISRLVPGKRVVETGSRSGLFCYASIVYGCSHITGIELDPAYSTHAKHTFEQIGVSNHLYRFINGDAAKFDYSGVDIVLCLGLLYNLPDSHKHMVLDRLRQVPLSIVEFWCIEDGNPEPHTTEVANEWGPQYKPNKKQLELFLKEHGFNFREITPRCFKNDPVHTDRYYLCKVVALL